MFVPLNRIAGRLVHSVLGLVVGLLAPTIACPAQELSPEAVFAALRRAQGWLEQHPADPSTEKIGSVVLDVWAWDRFATLHADAAVRAKAGAETRQRLLRLPPPGELTPVNLTYWAVLLRLADFHKVARPDYREAAAGADRSKLLQGFKPTTIWWTERLLAFSGIGPEPDFSATVIAQEAGKPENAFTPTVANVYQVFHELVPAADLGHAKPRLSAAQMNFVKQALPALLRVARETGDTDAVAEALVSAALVGARNTDDSRMHTSWLLSRQRSDGAFESKRDRGRTETAGHYRHVVLVASWALLTTNRPETGI